MASFLREMYCVVPGCLSTLPFVQQWRKRPCLKPEHAGKTHQECSCPEPRFYNFPTDVLMRMLWLKQVKRPHLEVTNSMKVCSRHFKDPNPLKIHLYFPDKNLEQGQGDGEYDEFRFTRFTYPPQVTVTRVESINANNGTPSTSWEEPTMIVPIKIIKTNTAKPKGVPSQAVNLPYGPGSTATTSLSGQDDSKSITKRLIQLLLEPSMGAKGPAEVPVTRVETKNETGGTPSTSCAKPTMLVPIKTIITKTTRPKGATSKAVNLPPGSGSTATTSLSGQEDSESKTKLLRQLLLEPSMGAKGPAEVPVTRVETKNETGGTPSTSCAKPTMLVPIKTIITKTTRPKGATSQAVNLPPGSGSTATTSLSGQEDSESKTKLLRQLLMLEPSMGAERRAECGSTET